MEEKMSLHEALRLALSEIYATLDKAEGSDTEDWITPPDALREAARVIDRLMRAARTEHEYLNRNNPTL